MKNNSKLNTFESVEKDYPRTAKQLHDHEEIFGTLHEIAKSVNVTLTEYEAIAETTANFPNKGKNLRYCLDGLASEVGEIFGHVKRISRDDCVENLEDMSEERRKAILKELGDCLWYLTMAAQEAGSSLEEISLMNLEKLLDRQERNAIKGEGDER
jgi:NTP pyrophosphatase (non-canonical NTP hydrolase)